MGLNTGKLWQYLKIYQTSILKFTIFKFNFFVVAILFLNDFFVLLDFIHIHLSVISSKKFVGKEQKIGMNETTKGIEKKKDIGCQGFSTSFSTLLEYCDQIPRGQLLQGGGKGRERRNRKRRDSSSSLLSCLIAHDDTDCAYLGQTLACLRMQMKGEDARLNDYPPAWFYATSYSAIHTCMGMLTVVRTPSHCG